MSDMDFPFLHMEKMEAIPASHTHPKHTDPTCFLQLTAFSQSVLTTKNTSNKLSLLLIHRITAKNYSV